MLCPSMPTTIRLIASTYTVTEPLQISKNVTIEAAEGVTPVFDGRDTNRVFEISVSFAGWWCLDLR